MAKIYYCFPEGRHKALAMSYDDGRRADERLVGIFNKYGIKGTFHLNAGLLGGEDRLGAEEALRLYQGHEISAHTLTHPTLARCPLEQVVHEVSEDRKALETLIGKPVRGMSYPNGSYTPELKPLLGGLGMEYSRVVPTTDGGFGLPEDWMEWRATCHHNRRLEEHAETFVGLHKRQYLYLMTVWGHSYEFDNDDNWDVIERFGQIAGGREEIWYAGMLDIVHYMKACRNLIFSAACDFVYNPSAAPVWLEADGEIVEVPGGAQVQLG